MPQSTVLVNIYVAQAMAQLMVIDNFIDIEYSMLEVAEVDNLDAETQVDGGVGDYTDDEDADPSIYEYTFAPH